ncbi:hypothetical protein TIFTF001_043012 [Ficus carica]|uniref:Uncharacterized protein n=1 Tax=Ficus carica TaxID=3494 RepID=A0AA88CW79_FICCA|nr:hypothetical protein TIFTF001_043012 [Ficus carica]
MLNDLFHGSMLNNLFHGSMLNVMFHGLSWIGLATPTTPWLCATVSNLLAIRDVRLWKAGTTTMKCGMDTATGFEIMFGKMCLENVFKLCYDMIKR